MVPKWVSCRCSEDDFAGESVCSLLMCGKDAACENHQLCAPRRFVIRVFAAYVGLRRPLPQGRPWGLRRERSVQKQARFSSFDSLALYTGPQPGMPVFNHPLQSLGQKGLKDERKKAKSCISRKSAGFVERVKIISKKHTPSVPPTSKGSLHDARTPILLPRHPD